MTIEEHRGPPWFLQVDLICRDLSYQMFLSV